MRTKITDLALSQVGIKEIPQNQVKYNTWYYGREVNGSAYAWCAVFISWLANQCEIMNTLIPRYSGCGTGVNWFKDRGQWINGGNTPKKGDIIFFKPTKAGAISSHTGIVVSVDNGTVTTVEGNKSNQVKKCTYSKGFNQILGYGQPAYEDEPEPNEPKKSEIIYQTYDNSKKKWLNEIVSNKGEGIMSYAGNFGNPIGGIRLRTTDNSYFEIKSHIKGGSWLETITKWDDTSNGYSGIKGKNIDGIAMNIPNHQFRVHANGKWYGWINKYDINDWVNGVAGVKGKSIDAIQIR